ncbi:S-formylglutathione hydrolase [Anabaena sp. FACHB-709]|uniref:S-formylglutathione hydrolase n=2 Tax=Nostocaceae TaxID=1162 RepID=A0A1Z4KHJ1_ANAVA|nr:MULTISPECIES: S-formylglutathione hydrolase [Nostocaceae]BAY68432.1 S-formylglutathione hydrolase [Trichormus variabilis NIES-23]HBW32678.1 S-formylglutathione hydrolase [Nostoc sp. UBA8866]MBD2171758.1 S-formylglutathione hydrolase [Anabaena cylindrica FACHB-318]MBD2264277.1 S-formylglutathione hydrolase [Anabaena sp. FACHB-709]MBD2273620.1 S-formylglutathione hydrolase [Nostoc sp. PCC 7120 = FACHB-418]
MNNLKLISEYQSFGGKLGFYSHPSSTCNGEMRFAVYQPPQAAEKPLPVLYFLSGLTCTEENFMAKAGAQRYAAEYGLILVAPDTSPRNTGIAGEDDEWDFGTGAGFYVDATEKPWRSHYQMYSYIVQELPALIAANFPIQAEKQGIFGHSMGGHGALVCALRNPHIFKSVSAFAPIVTPMGCPWGQKAFSRYLGNNQASWLAYDASELVKQLGYHSQILIDQGTSDKFLTEQLLTDVFAQACQAVNQPLNLRYQAGYDHSYYFIASFIADHIRHHATSLERS